MSRAASMRRSSIRPVPACGAEQARRGGGAREQGSTAGRARWAGCSLARQACSTAAAPVAQARPHTRRGAHWRRMQGMRCSLRPLQLAAAPAWWHRKSALPTQTRPLPGSQPPCAPGGGQGVQKRGRAAGVEQAERLQVRRSPAERQSYSMATLCTAQPSQAKTTSAPSGAAQRTAQPQRTAHLLRLHHNEPRALRLLLRHLLALNRLQCTGAGACGALRRGACKQPACPAAPAAA